MNLKDFIAAVRRFWLTFVLVTVAALTVGLAWIFLTAEKFVSTAQLMVSIEGSTTATAYQNDEAVSARINTYIPLLTSGAVTQRVIDELGLPLTTSELADKINATRVPPWTALIDLTVTDSSPQQAQLIADTLANEFVDYTAALETPTGDDAARVHTTVVSGAGEAHGNYAERIFLGVLVSIAAALLGSVAVWARARNGAVALTAQRVTDTPEEPALAAEEPALTYASETTVELPGWHVPDLRVRERLHSISARIGPPKTWVSRLITTPPVRDSETASVVPVTEVVPEKTESPGRDRATTDGSVKTEPRGRTPWLLGVVCFLTPALPTVVVPPGPLKSNGSPARLIAVMLLGLVMLGFFLIRRTSRSRTVAPGALIVLMYLALNLIIYGIGLTQVSTEFIQAGATRFVIMLLAQAGLALYIITRLHTIRQRTFILGCLAAGLTWACLTGVLQSMGIDLRYLLQPPGFVHNLDIDEITGERFGVNRVNGTSQHSIEYSVLAAVTVPITIHFARYAAKREVRWLAGLGCLTALVALPAAVSRTGIIALAIALLVYMWNFKVRSIAITLVGGVGAGFIYTALVPGTAQALWSTIVGSGEDTSVEERVADYAQVGESFRANPFFGTGWGTSDPTIYGYLDNQWLQTLVQGGLVGITAELMFVIGGLFGISAALRTASTPRERDQAYMLGAVFVAIASTAFTFDLYAYQQATFVFYIVFGLLWSTFKVPIENAEPGPILGIATNGDRSASGSRPLVGVR